ncbi:Na/Pi symporter [Carboxydochorda subterranea]|uniref:Na/Pi symporter n=1 Tax=Carboxydichorda subterranea TaxID=3109565 RepID=A0ABZ1BZY6_9FIRM|nr:Na/Pi symporter [Limnochorda sp. L945t]WRP18372.1 Na/Pi symporter [Limnochorda sp. L945t]
MLAVAGVRLAYLAIRTAARSWVQRWFVIAGDGPVAMALSGMLAAALAHSSSMVEVLALGLVQTEGLPMAHALYVIIGANVGTTLTAQLVALQLPSVGIGMMAVGAGGYLLSRQREFSLALFSIGAFLQGMEWIGRSLGPLATGVLGAVEGSNSVLRAFGLGWLVTSLIQSSTTVTTSVVNMVAAGLMETRPGVAAVLGSNVGTVTTGLVASLFMGRGATRLAMADFFLNLVGAAVALVLFRPFHDLVTSLAGSAAQSVAHAHTLFNLLSALVSFPLVPKMARWLEGR